MRYNLGYMDLYPIEATGSVVENNPMYVIKLTTPVDPIRLEAALNKAAEVYPLFKTKVKYDKEYYLTTNDNPIKLIHAKESERPLVFGKLTNDYPWQCCYYDNTITFEWLHGVSDGVGSANFITYAISVYCGSTIEPKLRYLVAPGLEPFFDKAEKGETFETDPEGFSFKDFPKIKNRGYRTDCHFLKAPTSEILECARTNSSSVTPIIAILFSKALRKHLPEKLKNRRVASNIVMDLRRPLNYDTMHNCVEYKRITYVDEFDNLSFREVAKIYKEKLDVARLTPNVVRMMTERIKLFKAYHIFKGKKLLKAVVRLIGLILKDTDCNFVVTYPGKLELPPEVLEHIDDMYLKLWHDFGECIIGCMDFNGVFNINICENFKEKGVVEDFIEISKEIGIHWEEVRVDEFEQAHFSED